MADRQPMEQYGGDGGEPSNRNTVRRLRRFLESQTPATAYELTHPYGPAYRQTRGPIDATDGGDQLVAQTSRWEPARPPARPARDQKPKDLASEEERQHRGRRRPEPSAAAEVRELREIVTHEASLSEERANILYEHIEDRFATLMAAQEGDRELKVASLNELRIITQLLRDESGKRHSSTSTNKDHDSSPDSSEPATPKISGLLSPMPTRSEDRNNVDPAQSERKSSGSHESRKSKDKRGGDTSKEKDKGKKDKDKEREKSGRDKEQEKRDKEKEQEKRDNDNDKEREGKKKDKHKQAEEEVSDDARKLVEASEQRKPIGSTSSTDWQGTKALDGYA